MRAQNVSEQATALAAKKATKNDNELRRTSTNFDERRTANGEQTMNDER